MERMTEVLRKASERFMVQPMRNVQVLHYRLTRFFAMGNSPWIVIIASTRIRFPTEKSSLRSNSGLHQTQSSKPNFCVQCFGLIDLTCIHFQFNWIDRTIQQHRTSSATMNQLFNTYNMNMNGMNPTMDYDNTKKSFGPSQPDSLFSMALYEFEAAQQQQLVAAPAAPKRPGHFYPVDEYKDMSLREILDISDDFLFDDIEPTPARQENLMPPMAPNSTALVTPPPAFNQDPSNTFNPNMGVLPTPDSSLSAIDLSPKKKRSRDDFEYDENEDDEDDDGTGRRFRPYQAGQWSEKFAELCAYRDVMGHCLVPHTYSENLPLARWVKRQRYQYKLMRDGKSSTMTEERVKALEDIGFIWDSQGAAWGERLAELRSYRQEFGHCNVPSNFSQNPQLATWVKCQRRQYKLHQEGKPSNMTPQRVRELENLGFEWELRSYKKARV